jgi:glucose/arabinose dehydrogenase/mono/diheme cytochrome c family protein
MNSFGSPKAFLTVLAAVIAFCWGPLRDHAPSRTMDQASTQGCPSDDSGLKLPPGFCATVFADGIGHARHMVVAPNGVLYSNTWSGTYYGNGKVHPGGFLVALEDKSGAGKADVIERFGETVQTQGAGGTGIGIFKGSLYAEINDRIVRYLLPAGSVVPKDPPQTIVSGLPLGGDHPMHPFIIDSQGSLYIDVASATNSCQLKNRMPKSSGAVPCTELETRGGIWRFDANKSNQKFSPADRFATGIRNGDGFAIDENGRMFVAQQGRDQLHANWPELYKPEEEATLPAEEVVLLKRGGDYGWPECYYDPFVEKLVLAPEYGGDGKKRVGICANKIAPVVAFPAHWAPNDITYYDQKQFPERYRDGIFVAFHGSWDRAPYPQGGYNVVFQGLSGGRASGPCEIFADGFAGAVKSPGQAEHRPAGLAVAPDGTLYVSDDVRGRIYRIVYLGGSANQGGTVRPCPRPTAPAGSIAEAVVNPPEGTHPNAGVAASSHAALPKGTTPEMVALGRKIYVGQIGGAPCTACHGDNGEGSTLGPPLTAGHWLWGDGSYASIRRIIVRGVSQPKRYRNIMPPLGGAQLTHDEVSAVAAYVWTLSHR